MLNTLTPFAIRKGSLKTLLYTHPLCREQWRRIGGCSDMSLDCSRFRDFEHKNPVPTRTLNELSTNKVTGKTENNSNPSVGLVRSSSNLVKRPASTKPSSTKPANTKPKRESRAKGGGKRNNQRAFRQLSEKFKQKVLAAQVRFVPALIAPKEGLARLREARLLHPLYMQEGPIQQHLRGYLSASSTNPGSMWQESRAVPSDLSPSAVFDLHELGEADRHIDDTVLYISSDTGTVVGDDVELDESFDSSILEVAAHVIRSPSHVSNSLYEGDFEVIVLSDDEESVISPDGYISDNDSVIAETPQYAMSITSATSVKDFDNSAHSSEDEADSPYSGMKMQQLRSLLKARGIKKAGRTKKSVVQMLIMHDEGGVQLQQPAIALSASQLSQPEIEHKLTDFIRTEHVAQPWWEKVLCYEPLVIESFHKFVLEHSGITMTLAQLKLFCDNNGICFTAADDRRARKKK